MLHNDSAVSSPRYAQGTQPVPSLKLDAHSLMVEWEQRLHQVPADIVAYASNRVALSGEWLQCNAGAVPGGRLQSPVSSLSNGSVQRGAGEATYKTFSVERAPTLRVTRPSVDKNDAKPTHESHFRPNT